MSGYWYKNGQGSVIVRVKLNDSSQTIPNNKGITALVNSSAGLIISTIADTESAPINYTQAGGTIQTIATIGTYAAPSANNCRFQKIDDTNLPGWYEIQLLNARFSVANAKTLGICIPAVAGLNLAQTDLVIPLTAVDPYVTDMGLTETSEAYASKTGQSSFAAILRLMLQTLWNRQRSGTAFTVLKEDGATTAATGTYDSASNPTQLSRTT
jgi:hypothetical protein